MLTQEKLKFLFDYDEKTGWIINKINRSNNAIKKGTRAGNKMTLGYRCLTIDGKTYKEHHLIWFYHYGYLPKQLDHINRIKDDNRIENLREANNSQNQVNRPKLSFSKSSFKGITRVKSKTINYHYQVKIRKNNKRYNLGTYRTPEEAAKVYNQAALRLHGEFAYLNNV